MRIRVYLDEDVPSSFAHCAAVEKPLYIYDKNGNYTDEVKKVYGERNANP